MNETDILSKWTTEIKLAFTNSKVLCIAILSDSGDMIYCNKAMQAIFEKDKNVYFVNPDKEFFMNMPVDIVFEGMVTIGNDSPFNTVISSRVYKKYNEILITGEVDVKTLAEQNEKMTELNFEITNLQRQLIKEKKTLEQTLKQLKETQSMLIHSEKMNALGNLVAGIAHEINNPLSFVYSNFTSLKKELNDIHKAFDDVVILASNDKGNKFAKEIKDVINRYDLSYTLNDAEDIIKSNEDGLTRIKKLVDDLRKFSRHDEASIKTIELISNLQSTMALALPEIRSKTITCKLISPPEINIECYPSELNQAFLNLLINSIQAIHTQKGLIVVEVKDEDSHVQIKVIDNGIGIPHEIHKDIFNPFFTTKPVGTGTGLGLSIAYKIITNLHGGLLSFESEVDQGSTFTMLIPKQQKQK